MEKLIQDMKIPDEQIAVTRKVLSDVLEQVLQKIKSLDPFYQEMIGEVVFTGSYFEGLRVREATEFDLNIVLNLPRVPKRDTKVIVENCPEGHGKLKIETPIDKINNMPTSYVPHLKRLVDDEQYVIPELVRRQFKSIFDRISIREIKVNGVKQIRLSESGPAKTLYISLNNGLKVDVDLVPVFHFPTEDWPTSLNKGAVKPTPSMARHWYLVPKDYKRSVRNNPREPKEADIPKLWRVHHPGAENTLFDGKKFSKPLVRLLKDLRDKQQNLKNICSYYLKTVVFHETVLYNGAENWNDVNREDRFIKSLLRLRTFLDQQKLPHILFPENNLFRHLSDTEMMNIRNRINVIVKKIQADPNSLTSFFNSR